ILEEDKSIFAYLRNYKNEKLLVINNFYGKESLFKLPTELKLDEYKNKILISNYKDSPIDFREINLRPYESIVYHLEEKSKKC
ncbi:alpha-glucosidase C-terminal domain-containing protein, partial [Clostridium botulinum]